MATKICSVCGETKSIDIFPLNGIYRRTYCNTCRNEKEKKYSELKKQYIEDHKEELKEKAKEYYIKNESYIKARQYLYREENKEKIADKDKKYRQTEKGK